MAQMGWQASLATGQMQHTDTNRSTISPLSQGVYQASAPRASVRAGHAHAAEFVRLTHSGMALMLYNQVEQAIALQMLHMYSKGDIPR